MNFWHHIKKRFSRSIRTLTSLAAYDLWASAYAPQAHNPLMEVEQAAMLALLPSLKNKIVLDLACGTGRYAHIVLVAGAKTVIGLDNSLAMLRVAEMPNQACASTTALCLPSKSVDVILCGLALGHVADLETSLAEISRVLRPNGIALISDFHPYQALQGAQRTFTAVDGATYAVEHHIHHITEYFSLAQKYQLTLTALSELPVVGSQPAVLVMRFQKQG